MKDCKKQIKEIKRYELLDQLYALVQPFKANCDLSDEVIFECYKILNKLTDMIKENNRDLKREFSDLIDDIFKTFNNLDTSLYTEDAYYSGDFYFEDLHSELIEGLFCEIDKKINYFYNQNNLFEVMFILLATYYAILKEPDVDDEHNVFMDYNEALHNYWQELFITFIKALEKASLTKDEKEKFFNFLNTLDKSNITDDIYKVLKQI